MIRILTAVTVQITILNIVLRLSKGMHRISLVAFATLGYMLSAKVSEIILDRG